MDNYLPVIEIGILVRENILVLGDTYPGKKSGLIML